MKCSTYFKALSIAALLFTATAHAAQWPDHPITMVVPFAAGGSTDSTARLIAQKLEKTLKESVVIENRAGAGSNIGNAFVAKSPPDGYTLLFASSTIAANVSLYKSTGFDLKKDLTPVSEIALIPNVLVVNNHFPAKTLADFITYVREKKGPVDYGSAGNGTSQHLSGALFNHMVGGAMMHVPYKGGAPANVDLLGGQIQAVFAPLVEVLPFIDSGKLRALGVTTKDRSPRLPNVPSINESLPGYEVVLWNGVFVPAGTPAAIVDKLASALHKIMQDPAVRKTLIDQGSTPVGNSPAEFKQILATEIEKWGQLVKLSGAQVN